MSPDERTVAALVASALRRARGLAAAEAAAWAGAAAALGYASARMIDAPIGLRAGMTGVPAMVAAVVCLAQRMRTARRPAIIRALERAEPLSRNLIATADEIERGELGASARARTRVFGDAAAIAGRVDVRTAVPGRAAAIAWAAAAVAWILVAAVPEIERVERMARVQRVDSRRGNASPRALNVSVTIRPPSYTGRPTAIVDEPSQVQAIEGSELVVTVVSGAERVSVDHDGRSRSIARDRDGRFVEQLRAARTGYLLIAADAARRTIPIVVVPDALPTVTLTAPGRDLVFGGGNPRIGFDVHATDDFGVTALTIRYTKVSGSGENFEFQDGEIPLDVSRNNGRDWSGRASRTVAELGLEEGSMLVYRGVASDARPGGGTGVSDAFFIEISKLGVAAGDAFTLPEEETRYALSQQMLIVKTERLHQRRAAMRADAVAEEAMNLAVEQRMIRAEFVFMLGGEVEDEDVEAERSSELQEGRLQNRGQADLRAATVAMSQAEKALTAANTADALAAERAAVAALQRAFARGRYILRALGTRSQLDLSRRLTGNSSGATGVRRSRSDAPPNRRAAILDDLLRGVSLLDSKAAPADAQLLAAEALRLDPESPSMRDAAAALQAWGAAALDPDAAARSRAAAIAALAAESRRAHSDPPVAPPTPASDLAGAFADALKGRR